MIIEPTIGEVVFYAVFAVIGIATLIIANLPWNPYYERKEDPYKYCPKEEKW
jgi:hypothetical protein